MKHMPLTKDVLITAAVGFVGSQSARTCLATGYCVTALDSLTDYYEPTGKRWVVALHRDHPSCTFAAADLSTSSRDSMLASTEIAFYLAGQPGARISWGDRLPVFSRENIDACRPLFEMASRHRGEKLVYASSSIYGTAGAYSTPRSLTPAPASANRMTKVAGKHLAAVSHRNRGLPVNVLRCVTFYRHRRRPDMAFDRLIAAGELVTSNNTSRMDGVARHGV
jgi:nucleoside-diphosphate-sugar epimerase